VKSRYPETRLVELTNLGDESATVVDDTVLGLAATDVMAEFPIYVGVAYDNSDARHVPVAVSGVIAKLYLQGETPGSKADSMWDAFIERLRSLAKVTGRDRIVPVSSSVLTPTPERDGTETVRPDTDRPDFDDLIPDAP